MAGSGRNLQQSFVLVAADTPAPLGDELRLCARRMEMGLEPSEATRDLVERTGVTALTMLSSAIAVNQETGGDLIVVLERLSTSVRDRLHFSSRQRGHDCQPAWGLHDGDCEFWCGDFLLGA